MNKLTSKIGALGFLVSLFITLNSSSAFAQSFLVRGPLNNEVLTTFYDKSGRLGIGTVTPTSWLNINKTSIIPLPLSLFKVEFINSGGYYRDSIIHFTTQNNTTYGLFEAGNIDLINYFQHPVQIGKTSIGDDLFNSNNVKISTPFGVEFFTFNMNPNLGPATTPLIINGNGIAVNDNLVTTNFQLLANHGNHKVLVSDANGNGIWTDPITVIDLWQKSRNGLDIYTNYRNVGIGTPDPTFRFEIWHDDPAGGMIINQTGNNETSSLNSEIRFNVQGNEHWAIGNNLGGEDNSSFFIWNNTHTDPTKSHAMLYIDGANYKTGIATIHPAATLDVNGDFKAAAVGIGIDPPVNDPYNYKLFVEGGIAAREVKVTINTFPDYVFSGTYKLLSMGDLEKYITLNNHLPNMPASSDVNKNNGVELGALQVKLVEKIEEQTLYILDLQKQVNELKQQMDSLIKK